MKPVQRLVEAKLRTYRAAFPCVVVVGARQVGKTTLLQHLFADSAGSFVIDPVQDQYGARRDPDLLLRNNPPPLILDEVQYATGFVPAIKRARVSQRAKGHVWDTGLACHMMRISSPEAVPGHPAFGALFESLVVGDCLRQLQKEQTVPAAWHYRRHSGAEVDLILERDGKLFPIEVKATSNPTDRDARGVTAFQEEYGKQAAPGLLVHAGDRVLRITERCMAIPFDLLRT